MEVKEQELSPLTQPDAVIEMRNASFAWEATPDQDPKPKDKGEILRSFLNPGWWENESID